MKTNNHKKAKGKSGPEFLFLFFAFEFEPLKLRLEMKRVRRVHSIPSAHNKITLEMCCFVSRTLSLHNCLLAMKLLLQFVQR